MNQKIALGQEIQAIVTDVNQEASYAQKSGITYRVIADEAQKFELGQVISGFAYQNMHDELVMFTGVLPILSDQYVFSEVVKVHHGLGVFVDVGLPEKDIAVSSDDLPNLKHLWPIVGHHVLIKLVTDHKGQLWGKLPSREYFEAYKNPGSEDLHNEDFEGVVVALHKKGTYLFTTDRQLIFVHESERYEEPKLGAKVSGRFIGVRDDGVMYGSLLPRAHEVINDDAQMILETLKRSLDGKISVNNKSMPEEIYQQFGISKARFKRAIGSLYKERLIDHDETGTWLVSK